MAQLPAPEDYGRTAPAPIGKPGGGFVAPQGRAVQYNTPIASGFTSNASLVPGQVLSGIGGELSAYAQKAQAEYDTLEAQDALTKLTAARMDLTIGDGGFKKLTGSRALETPIAQTYGEKLKAVQDDISGKMRSSNARKMFESRAGQVSLGMRQDALQHSMVEGERAKVEGMNASLGVIVGNIAAQPGDERAIREGLDNAEAIYRNDVAQSGETRPDVLTQQHRKLVGPVHAAAISGFMSMGNAEGFTKAQGYLNKFGDQMDTDTLVKASAELKATREHFEENALAGVVRANNNPALTPAPMSRLSALAGDPGPQTEEQHRSLASAVAKQESGNREYDASGQVIQGPPTKYGTAKGKMQVLDATAAKPGYGVTPARDNSPEERTRVGEDLLRAFLVEYGDVEKALAAYNWGPGNLNAHLKNMGSLEQRLGWKNGLPSETQKYIRNVTGNYNSGARGTPEPTMAQALAQTEEAGRKAGFSDERIARAQAKVRQNFGNDLALREDTANGQLQTINARIMSGEISDPSQITLEERATMGVEKAQIANKAIKQAIADKSKAAQDAHDKDPASQGEYAAWVLRPDLLVQQSPADIMKMAETVGTKRMNDLLEKRMHYIQNPKEERKAMLDAELFTDTANQLGLPNKSPKDKAERLRYKQQIEDTVRERQQATGKPVTFDEMRTITRKALAPYITAPAAWYAPWSDGTSVRGADLPNLAALTVPPAFKEQMRENARIGKHAEPTEAEYRDAYAGYVADKAYAKGQK